MAYKRQRELADSITSLAPLNDIRVQIACGARVGDPVTQGLRPLHYAVYQRYTDCIRLLILRGADVNCADNVGYTPLHLAAERGYLDVVLLLLDHNPTVSFVTAALTDPAVLDAKYNPDFPRRDHLPDEPLRLALKNDHLAVAQVLLQSGADPNAKYFMGAELNMIPPWKADHLELLLKWGAQPDSRDRQGMTTLMRACKHSDCLESVVLLVSHGADVNSEAGPRQDFRLVLHYAVIGGSLETTLFLIKQGARVNPPPGYSQAAPLDYAILKDDVNMVRLLLSRGADVNRVSGSLGSPLHVAAAGTLSKNQLAIIRLLLRKGADPNLSVTIRDPTSDEPPPFLRTPLVEYLAGRDDYDSEIVQTFLEHGAEVAMSWSRTHPAGVLRYMRKLRQHDDILEQLLLRTHVFDLAAIRAISDRILNRGHREQLLQLATTVPPLKHLCRLKLRETYRSALREMVLASGLPPYVADFVTFDIP